MPGLAALDHGNWFRVVIVAAGGDDRPRKLSRLIRELRRITRRLSGQSGRLHGQSGRLHGHSGRLHGHSGLQGRL